MDFDRLYRRHVASVYRYAYAVLGNHADAEDVTQQTFLNAYRAIERGTKPRKAENWLLTIAHNEVRRHFRRTLGKPLEVELDEELPDPAAERGEPRLTDVVRALQQLTPAQRSALVMREFEGRSYTNISEVMGLTPSALEALIFRARRALAEQLDDAFTCAESEQALLRRLDGRLPRREARRLKAHLRECPLCVRFADVQKRQRAVLKGLSIMPIPASLFLFRGEQAAASAGLGAGAAAAGSAAVGGGSAAVGTGAAGFAAGFAAKVAAVTAAAAVAGGVGYGVTTSLDPAAAGPEPIAEDGGQPVVEEAAVAIAEPNNARRAAVIRSARARSAGGAAIARSQRKAIKVKTRPAKTVRATRKAARAAARQAAKAAKRAAKAAEKAAKTAEKSAKAAEKSAKAPVVTEKLERMAKKPRIEARPRTGVPKRTDAPKAKRPPRRGQRPGQAKPRQVKPPPRPPAAAKVKASDANAAAKAKASDADAAKSKQPEPAVDSQPKKQ